MTGPIHNPFAGLPVAADWAWHKANGYQGGTDYKEGPGHTIRAACAGTVYVGDNGLSGSRGGVRLSASLTLNINYREVGHLVGEFPRKVKSGEVIGVTGSRYPHIDATRLGIRIRFEPLITPTAKPASTGTITPVVDPRKRKHMPAFVKVGDAVYLVTPDGRARHIERAEWAGWLAAGAIAAVITAEQLASDFTAVAK